MAAAAALGLGVPVFWMVGRRGDHPLPAGATAAREPLFQRFVVPPGDDPTRALGGFCRERPCALARGASAVVFRSRQACLGIGYDLY
jgi:hypothetical protein